ncbi:MAG: STAS domain-containing protein [Prevotella sp.]|nr:STAS domain-containing protein [Prevotella sp.]MBR6015652.1 STAS domain-containing protein [Prevotella sp.]MBR6446700.1 STAS domain-containing protein [Prevotella sp.]MBR6493697.1 STAS domain-containing protein [Prevotella sp.]
MKTNITEQNGCLTATFEGRLDTAAAQQTEKDLSPLYDCSGCDIVLDCTQLEYISSSGLRIFLGILKNAKSKGHHVYIQNINDDLRNVFAITGFANLFEFK